MNRKTTGFTLLLLLASVTVLHAQSGQWTWMGGRQGWDISTPATFGTQGTASLQTSPGDRQLAATWTDAQGNLWLFGGQGNDSTGTFGSLNDLWMYSPATGLWTWVGGSNVVGTQGGQTGRYGTMGTASATNVPGGRYEAGTWTDSSGNLWLFGGTGFDSAGASGQLNDLWKFNPTSQQWTWMGGSNTVGANGGQYGVYGVQGTGSAGNIPGGRYGAAAWTDGHGNFWMFGGAGFATASNPGLVTLNDLWEFSPSSGQWTWWGGETSPSYGVQGQANAANQPGGRISSVTWVDASGVLWMFGGLGYDASNTGGDLNDLWSYNPTTHLWTWASGSSSANQNGDYGVLGSTAVTDMPGGRWGANAWTDANGNVWLFGGSGVDPTGAAWMLNDLWMYNPASNEWTWEGGSSTRPPDELGATGVYGTIGVASDTNVPGGRDAGMAWKDLDGNFWLYGGTAGQSGTLHAMYSDLWRLGAPASTAAAPQAVLSPALVQVAATAGSGAASQSIMLSNIGSAALMVSSIAITGSGAASFSQSNNCGSSVGADSSCTIDLTFTPPAAGAVYATLAVDSNAGTATVPLIGLAKSPTTLSLQASAATNAVLTPVTFTATLAPYSSSAGTTNGEEVTFSTSSRVLGNAPLVNGVATFSTTGVPLGTSQVSASYAGDNFFNSATSAAVTYSVTEPTNLTATSIALALLVAGQPVTSTTRTTAVHLTATVTSGNSPVHPGVVTFCDAAYPSCINNGLIGVAQTNSQGVATLAHRFGAGAHGVIAKFQSQVTYAASVSSPAVITVGGAVTTAALVSSGNTSGYTLAATITGLGPSTAPTGSVQFIDQSNGNAVLGTVQLGGATQSTSFNTGPAIADSAGILGGGLVLDLNGDGIPDIVMFNGLDDASANLVPANITVYLGNGDGTFQALPSQPVISGSPGGQADLSGGFGPPLASGDFNQDGIPDLAVGVNQGAFGGIAILLGNGDGTFTLQPAQITAAQITGGSTLVAVPVVADFTGDGIPDVIAEFGADLYISTLYPGVGDGTFPPANHAVMNVDDPLLYYPYAITPGDYNGDGRPDVAVTAPAEIYDNLNPGNGQFGVAGSAVTTAVSLPVPNPCGSTPNCTPIYSGYLYSQVAGDFNGDGKQDLAVLNPNASNISIFLGNGDGTFNPVATTIPLSANEFGGLIVADFNGDGCDDLAVNVGPYNAGQIEILYSNGDGTFTPHVLPTIYAYTPYLIGAGDFSQSGRMDLVVADYDGALDSFQIISNQSTETATVSLPDVRLSGTGTHQIIAVYSGDSTFATSTSSAVALTGVSLGSTSTALTATPSSLSAGAPVTLTATVTGTALTGDVSFSDGANVIATLPVNGSGVATLTVSLLPTGSNSLTATYSGDANNSSSTSSPVNVTVNGGGGNPDGLDWTWTGGANVIGSSSAAPGNYGALGVPASANLPPGRLSPQTWTDNSGNFWIMGGTSISESMPVPYFNDLWEYSPTTLEWTWQGGANSVPSGTNGVGDNFGTQGTPSAQSVPGARAGGLSWTDPSGNLWLYGGYGVDGGYPSTTGSPTELLYSFWKYTPSSGQWTWIEGSDYGNPADVANSLPTYGVMGTPSMTNFPGARSDGSTWTDSAGNLWMFGGDVVSAESDTSTGLSESPIDGNDLWKFNPTNQEWTWEAGSQITAAASVNPICTPGVNGTLGQTAAGITPSGRQGSSSWVDSAGNLWLFGGQGCGSFNFSAAKAHTWGPLNDLWEFNTTTNEWTWMAGGTSADQSGVYGTLGTASAGNTPGERESAYSWTDKNGKFWLFGGSGYDSNGNYGTFNDLWMFDPSTNEWTWEGGATTNTGSAPLPGMYGTLGVGAAGNVPGGRDGGGAWSDASGNLWLFGGLGEDATGAYGYLNDLWEYGSGALVTTPQAAMPSFNPPAGNYSTAQSVTLSDTTPNATIYYTTNGNPPTTNSTVYSGTAIPVAFTETIEAIATASGYTQSATATATYTITAQAKTTPTVTVSPSPASITTAQALSVTIAVSGTPTPTGSVTLTSGTYTSGSVALSSGSVNISIPAGALAVGTDTLTATYTPDANSSSTFNPATGTNTVAVTAAVVSAPVASLTPAGPLSFTAASGSTSAAQTATLNNTGNTALSITGITITGTNAGSFAETNTCGASLPAGSNCTIAITFSPASAASFTATLSVADNASGSPQTITLNGTGTTSAPPAATFTLSSLTSTGTVTDTTAATYQLTVTPQNGSFTSPISLTVSGVPTGYMATFNPTSVTPGSSPATATLTISKSPTAMLERTLSITAPALALIGFFFVPWTRRRRLMALVLFAAAALGALTFTGCGGGFGLPTSTYNVTVTASGGGTSQTTTVQLTVRQ